MNLKEFLQLILASKDYYTLWIHKQDKKTYNQRFDDLDECIEFIEQTDKSTQTVYMAVGKFNNNYGKHPKYGNMYVQRKAEQATVFKTLCVDLDVDPSNPEKYASQKDAAFTIMNACRKVGFPMPMLVNSGYGVHAYWPLQQLIQRDVWVKLSSAMFNMFRSLGCKMDASKIKDPTMVLRPVGTHNKKKEPWQEVRVVREAPAYKVMDLANVLKEYKVNEVTGSVLSKKAKEKNTNAIVSAILDTEPTVIIDTMVACTQMKHILESNGALAFGNTPVDEPLWRASLGVAKFCIDAEQAAVKVSCGHPEYNEDDTLEKLNLYAGTGPTLCATFENLLPEGCASCPNRGKIGTPLQLGNGATEIKVIDEESGEEKVVEFPQSYQRKAGRIIRIDPVSNEEIFVSHYNMWVEARVTDVDEQTNHARVCVQFPTEGIKSFRLESSIIAAGSNDLRKALAEKQVYVTEDIVPVQRYLMNFLKKLQSEGAAIKSYSHYGWQADNSFLWGSELLHGNSTDKIHLEPRARQFLEKLYKKGTLENWRKATRVFGLKDMKKQGAVLLMHLAAPMFKFSGLSSAIVNMFSGDSGSGKTLTNLLGLAAWGDPEKMKLTAKATPNAVYKHLGTFGNAGGYMDESTTMDNKAYREMVMTVQDGKERERLNRSAEFMEQAHWDLPFFMSSNTDAYEILGGKITNEAEQLRVLQFVCDRTEFLSDARRAQQWHDIIKANFGHAGPAFIEAVYLESKGDVQEWYNTMKYKLLDEIDFEFLGQERFYYHLLVCAYIGAYIGAKYNLIDFDGMACIREVAKEMATMRIDREAHRMTGFDVVSQFLTENQDNIVVWVDTPTNSYAMQPTPRKAVARKEIRTDANDNVVGGLLMINRPAFREWCKYRGTSYKQAVSEMSVAGASVSGNVRRSLYKGILWQGTGQSHCIEIDLLSHEDFEHLREAPSMGEPHED